MLSLHTANICAVVSKDNVIVNLLFTRANYKMDLFHSYLTVGEKNEIPLRAQEKQILENSSSFRPVSRETTIARQRVLLSASWFYPTLLNATWQLDAPVTSL